MLDKCLCLSENDPARMLAAGASVFVSVVAVCVWTLDNVADLIGIGFYRESVMDLQLHGRIARVTGASQGIGRTVVRILAREGVKLAMFLVSPLAFTYQRSELKGLSLKRASIQSATSVCGCGPRCVEGTLPTEWRES